MHFSFKDLELFAAVAEAGSIAKAAERCHTVASAVSKRLSDLEDAFNTPLLVRGSKGVKLTAAGRALLARAHGVLNQTAQLEEEIKEFSSGTRGQVRVFANISAIVEFLPSVLATFAKRHPDIRIHLEEHVSGRIAQAVAERIADVGIVSDLPAVEGLTLIPFRNDELVLVARPDHELAGKKSIRFAEALAFDFVGLHSDSALHYRLLREASEVGRTLRVRIHVTSFDAICAMIAAGLGIGVVPRAAAMPYVRTSGLVALRLREDWAHRKLLICIRAGENLSVAARNFVQHLAKNSPPASTRPRTASHRQPR